MTRLLEYELESELWREAASEAMASGEFEGPRKRDTHIVIPSPSQLTHLRGHGGKRVALLNTAAQAYQRLLAAARADGIPAPLLEIVSGYRTTAYQKILWEQALQKYGSPEAANQWVARPGHSVHQSGRAIDFWMGIHNSSGNAARQRRTAVYRWLIRNADRFDFVPYTREPWHWEYTPRRATPTPRPPTPAPRPSQPQPATGGYVVYPNEVRVGGTRAWRNNNPGNIRAGDFTRKSGAIGQSGGFAVFPDEATGMRAIVTLLKRPSYQRLTIREAIKRYAPAADHNDPAAYTRFLQKETGLDPDRRVQDLSDTELHAMARAIRKVEGWRPGTIYTCNTPAPLWARQLLGCSGGGGVAPAPAPPVPQPTPVQPAPAGGATPALIGRESAPAAQTLYVEIPLGAYTFQGVKKTIPPVTGIFLPERFRPDAQVDILLYLHGHHTEALFSNIREYWNRQRHPQWPFRESLNSSNKNVILVAPSLGVRSNPGWLSEKGGLGNYLDRVLAALRAYGPYNAAGNAPGLGNLILACHSGGGIYMRLMATSGARYTDRIRECWGFDCLYNTGDETIWAQWARARPDAKLYVHYGSGGTAARSERLRRQGVPNVFVEGSTSLPHDNVPIKHWANRLRAATFLSDK